MCPFCIPIFKKKKTKKKRKRKTKVPAATAPLTHVCSYGGTTLTQSVLMEGLPLLTQIVKCHVGVERLTVGSAKGNIALVNEKNVLYW